MPRTDDDSWDITKSVGATALGVAAAGAAASEAQNPLIEDRFALMFLDAGGEGMWTAFPGSTLPVELTLSRTCRRVCRRCSTTWLRGQRFSTSSSSAQLLRARGRRWSWPRASMPARGGCRGPTGPPYMRSTSPKCCSSSRRRCSTAAPSRGQSTSMSQSICAMTGQRRCSRQGLTPRRPAPGGPKYCCRFCRRRLRLQSGHLHTRASQVNG